MSLRLPRGKARIGDVGRLSETRLAKDLGARLKPASGAMQGAKGDMTLPGILIEAKSTTGASMSIKHEWLAKIAAEARSGAKRPALIVSYTRGDGRPVPHGAWAMVPLNDYLELLALRETEE